MLRSQQLHPWLNKPGKGKFLGVPARYAFCVGTPSLEEGGKGWNKVEGRRIR